MEQSILEVKGLRLSFIQYAAGLRKQMLPVIDHLDIDLKQGEILAIVGSSGSGKSLLANAIFGILPSNAVCEGTFYYMGKEINQKDKERLRGKEWALIPQSVNYLDPLMNVEKMILSSSKGSEQAEKRLDECLVKYHLNLSVKKCYPHQLSGGMARKVLLATALAMEAKVIVADEPTPGLDEESLEEVLHDFKMLVEHGCSILMITHDIQAALKIADRVAIFYAGSTLEIAKASDFDGEGSGLRHPYTKALNEARPSKEFTAIEGVQPYCGRKCVGCQFCGRCQMHNSLCETQEPEFREVRNGKVRCHYAT